MRDTPCQALPVPLPYSLPLPLPPLLSTPAAARTAKLPPKLLMSLVSGPGRGAGMSAGQLPEELRLYVDKHVRYIQSLDTVRAALRFDTSPPLPSSYP